MYGCTLKKAVEYYGKIFVSNNCGLFQVVVANSTQRVKVVFLRTGTEVWTNVHHIESGSVVDRFYPSVCGVGYLGGYDLTVDKDGNPTMAYQAWNGMIDRCYGSKEIKSYKDCIVSEEFHNFTYFKQWYEKQAGNSIKGFELDKDILWDECKIYSEDVCVLVPVDINLFFAKTGSKRSKYPVGVSWCRKTNKFKSTCSSGFKRTTYHEDEWSAFLAYKQVKESRAKELAEKWKYSIDKRVYDKLMSYKVLLTD